MNPNEQAEALESARKAGIDLSLVDSNLAMTVKERWQQHDAALNLITAKEAMGREKDLLTVKELRAIAARRKQP